MEKILIVEDDGAVRKALTRLFESAGYAVETSEDGKSALELFHLAPPTAVVLDLGLPVVSGKDVFLQMKKQMSSLPVIIVTGRTDVVDRVLFLELGADDYVTKPFSPRELLARVRALIRSAHKPVVRDETTFDGICVDFSGMEVVRDGQPVVLTAEEFKILSFFLHNEDRNVSRDELLKKALQHDDYTSLRTVDNHILKLRQKLERDPANPIHFRTAHGEGYRFVR
jgi:DNA-binding response OmpR family regulator